MSICETRRVLLVVGLLSFAAQSASGAEISTNAAADRLVAVPTCRLGDTRMDLQNAEADTELQIDVRASRCGRAVPTVATAYAIRITSYGRGFAPDTIINRPSGPLVRYPSGTPLRFPRPPSDHISVDLEGYYLPPGVPVDALGSSGGTAMTDQPPFKSMKVGVNADAEGTFGKITLDGHSQFLASSIVAEPKMLDRQWIAFKSNDASGVYGVGIWNANLTQLMSVRSTGIMTVYDPGYMTGRTDYHSNSAVGNVVHNVTITNPRNPDGGSAAPVTFFRAWSASDDFSPATTKYEAHTNGGNDKIDVNFDSRFYYHWPVGKKYHFRAVSAADSADTFWVRTNVTSDWTRNIADMYVSGRVGFGTQAPVAQLHVEDLTADVDLVLSSGDNSGVPNFPTLTLLRKDGNDVQVAKYGLRLDSDDGNKFKLLYGANAAFTQTLLTVDMTGAPVNGVATAKLNVEGDIVARGVIGALYQDLAEWVPAAVDMSPGTVVVLNPEKSNEVMPSAEEYDVRVAGVVSAQPGLILGEAAASKEMIATTGRVKVKVDAARGPIRVGDLLVSSGKPGVAMKSQPIDVAGVSIHRPGTIIGKALEPLGSGEGEILVLLSLQ